ncbi:hypothetical protein [Dysgonomonas sp. ZJ279]|uniref:hypothetical protein n=1 Tax=Dysgonomonas sp. ZJ279 TaxID=2709796 RepID=UPI0013EDA0C2|nr:hypothetical protein [Dysgonomonas sp. ZJ279]
MSRKNLDIINNDRKIIELRMESEDLINRRDSLNQGIFEKEAVRIKSEIDNRISELYRDMEKQP